MPGRPLVDRDDTLERWSNKWSSIQPGQPGYWTRTLIPDLRVWFECSHGSMSYPLPQLLTGHGQFQQYRHKMGKVPSPICEMCTLRLEDTARHTFEVCPRFEEQRQDLPRRTGREPPITCEDMAKLVMADRQGWANVRRFATAVLREKQMLERQNTQA